MKINTVTLTEHGSYLVNKNTSPDDEGQMSVPIDPQNRYYRKVQAWIDAGNTPTPYSAPVKTYAENREVAYNALNQFELISDDSIRGTTTHKDAIITIKVKYPKPE